MAKSDDDAWVGRDAELITSFLASTYVIMGKMLYSFFVFLFLMLLHLFHKVFILFGLMTTIQFLNIYF